MRRLFEAAAAWVGASLLLAWAAMSIAGCLYDIGRGVIVLARILIGGAP